MQDGMAVCESCGMKFSKEEVKKMVVELSGPIQIDGEVKVTGVEDADALYRRAKDFERIGDLWSAFTTYSSATSKYPGDARLWLGLANVQVKRELQNCENELKKDGYYSEIYFRHSFMYSYWCNEIEGLYARAQSLGGVDDEAQQGLLWFRNQKEILIQKYKDKKKKEDYREYWERENAHFLDTHYAYCKDKALAFLLKIDKTALREELRKITGGDPYIESFSRVYGNSLRIHYKLSGSSVTDDRTIYLPEGMTIDGDIRPLFDGVTYKTGLFLGKKVYSWAKEPNKDKGPTFDE